MQRGPAADLFVLGEHVGTEAASARAATPGSLGVIVDCTACDEVPNNYAQ
jgi:hypothetical protein